MLEGERSYQRGQENLVPSNDPSPIPESQVIPKAQEKPWYIQHFTKLLIGFGLGGGAIAILLPWMLWLLCGMSSGSSDQLRLHLLYVTGGIIAVLTLLQTNWKNQGDRLKIDADIKKNEQDSEKNERDHIRQVHAERRSRYTKAVEQLSNEKATIRLGGIYTLVGLVDEWLADETLDLEEQQKEGQVIINNLCSYIRSPFPLATKIEDLQADTVPAGYMGDFVSDQAALREEQDVRRAIFDEMSKRSSTFNKDNEVTVTPGIWSNFEFNFSRAPIFYTLSNLTIEKANFFYATFYGDARFRWVNFINNANFFRAKFTRNTHFFRSFFTGEANFAEANFTQNANFGEAIFTQNTNFDRAIFTQNANFGEANFTQNANFNEANFTQNANFFRSTFNQNGEFLRTIFSHDVNFGEVSFKEKTNFFRAVFTQNVSFRKAVFSQNANFNDATFTQNANFNKTVFGQNGSFDETFFGQNANFRKAVFDQNASFHKTVFSQNANFYRAFFTQSTSFYQTVFPKNVSFQDVSFACETHFDRAVFLGNANFYKSIFRGNVSFIKATFARKSRFFGAIITGNGDFSKTIFERYVAFRNATFEGEAEFSGASFMRNADFQDAFFAKSPSKFIAMDEDSGKLYRAQFAALPTGWEKHNFTVYEDSQPIPLGTTELDGVRYRIPVGTVLFDSDSWDERQKEYTRMSEPAQ